jgi:hypothetical protein
MAVRGDDGADGKGQEVGDRLPFQGDSEENPPRDQGLPVQEEEKLSTQQPPAAPSSPTRAAVRGDAPAITGTRRSKAEGLADSTSEELTEAVPGASGSAFTEISGGATVADPMEPVSPDGQPAGDVAVPTVQIDRCGWCGSPSLWVADTGVGRIHCLECHAGYVISTGKWEPGERAKRLNPSSMPAPAA